MKNNCENLATEIMRDAVTGLRRWRLIAVISIAINAVIIASCLVRGLC